MKQPISIIIPLMGRVNEIKQFAKSFRPLINNVNEIIIIDDNSKPTDSIKIRDVCKKNRFKYYKNYKNFGAAKSKNLGAKLAKSRYLWFLDSDVIVIDKNILYYAVSFFKKHKKIIFGSETIKFKKKYFFRISKLLPNTYSFFMHNNFSKKIITKVDFIPSCNMFIDRKSFFQIGGFPNLITGEDKLFCLIAKKKNIPTFYNSKTAILHLHSASGRVKYMQQIKNIIKCHLIIFGFLKGSNLFYYYLNLIVSLPFFIISQINLSLNFNHSNKVKDKSHFFKTIFFLFFDLTSKNYLTKGNRLRDEL